MGAAGAEVTGSYWYPNTRSYMLMNVQHPYEDQEDKLCALRSPAHCRTANHRNTITFASVSGLPANIPSRPNN